MSSQYKDSLPAILILACSPRKQGNTDAAAASIHDALAACDRAANIQIIFLRDATVLPCVSCGACEAALLPTNAGLLDWLRICPLSGKDDAGALFGPLLQARYVFLLSPIYFYHLPAALKGLIDRMQPCFIRQKAIPWRLTAKTCYPVLIAGRPEGEALFSGSLLTLKYAFSTLGFSLGQPLLLKGLDASDALATSPTALHALQEYIRELIDLCISY